MTTSLDSTFGVWLVVFFFGAILYGMGLLQCWLYFHWYPHDSWRIKSTVLLLLFFETFQIITLLATAYSHLIGDFGNFDSVFMITWVDLAQLMGTYISALIVQVYFARCLYIFDGNNVYCSLLIVFLALVAFGAGIGETIIAHHAGHSNSLDITKIAMSTQSAATLLCDIVITVSLCTVFSHRKTGRRLTDSILHTLTVYAIGRGLLTAIAAASNFVFFLAFPKTFYFTLGLILSSKLYMNNMLFSLNSREHICNQADHEFDSTTMNLSSIIAAEPVQNDPGRFRSSAPCSGSITDANNWEGFQMVLHTNQSPIHPCAKLK